MRRNDSEIQSYTGLLLMAKCVILIVASFVLVGCSSQRPLMPTPYVYASGIKQPFSDSLPAELKTVNANILYATDRVLEPREDGRLDYGMDRSHSTAVGEAVVNLGGDISWEVLEADAASSVRMRPLHLEIVSVVEKVQGPMESLVFYKPDGGLATSTEDALKIENMKSVAREMLLRRLAIAPRKELLIFVHGVANNFDDALYTTAELWHFLGREFVPIAYSWPAGHSGLLRGYTYDRESSEFTVFHFKKLLEWLATITEVEGIHVIAHSRGTDVALTAIRELTIEARALGVLPQGRYKLGNVVIAAPDINLEVTLQRTEREGTRWAAEQWTTYSSPDDKAIGLAEWLFGGQRIGKAGYESIDDLAKSWAENVAHLDSPSYDSIIRYEGKGGGHHGHDYFRTNPSVASDLVLTVRFGRAPGAENGRPLEHVGGMFWKIDDDYLESGED